MKYQPGERLGRYEIQRLIGEGGLASVYLARDADLGRDVVVKLCRHDDAREWDTILVKEARILAELQHPSIVNIFDCGRERRGQFFLVLEYLDGGTLHDVSRDEHAQGRPQRLVDSVARIADTLDYVHRRGYLHRNIKPRAILQDQTDRPRLSSFEIAVQRTGVRSSDEEGIAGTPHYMAPEQLQDDPTHFGPHTDIWGLGVTLYEGLTGQRPFRAAGLEQLFPLILNSSPDPPSVRNATVPAELDRICLKCLAKKPENRYQNAALLAADLRSSNRAATPAPERRVFVSHSTEDREFVEREIISQLERNGIKTWDSKVDSHTAAEWHNSILRGLESCEWFLVVMSQRSAASDWVKDELHWAIDKRPSRIIPVLIDDCEVRSFHIRVARIQSVDFRTPSSDAREQLLGLFEHPEQ